MRAKTKTLLAALLLAIPALAPALPGVDGYLPDFSGEYVFYADSSFERASYVGFLYYDDSTYALRYYAPADSAQKKPEKDITLYVTVNPDAAWLEMTGERIVGTKEMEDTDIVNYLHDLFYEFTARRKAVTLSSTKPADVTDDFPQFGGTVTITYNALVPIFNIQTVRAADGKVLLQLQTVGSLENSQDASFAAFTGITGVPKDSARTFRKKKTAAASFSFEGQRVTLDGMWEQKLENVWLLGDNALLTLSVIALPADYAGQPQRFTDTLLRKLGQGTGGAYLLWPRQIVTQNGTRLTMMSLSYQPESKSVMRSFKVLQPKADGSYALLSLSVYDGAYQQDRAYFDAILKSYQP